MECSPSPSKCAGSGESKRVLDVLKGFTYLASFDELQQWSEEFADPLQRSNTPLVQRARGDDDDERSKVMLIHDYAGGYNDYESAQGVEVFTEQYSCEYLQNVESFVYFSHHLVSVPPPTWTNTCHRNGVKVLGTFIVEPGASQVDSILEQDDLGSYWVARKLACMAKHYDFDGWLVNIEAAFSIFSWSSGRLERFLRQLRAELGQGSQLVWYDALTSFNFVWYQNTLNYLNVSFALAAGSILTNYAWTPELALTGKSRAIQSGLGLGNIYYGIDVYAQNSQHGSKHKRTTWPKVNGGGTGTGMGVQALQSLGVNAGIFAPGWSYEHFSDHNRAVEKSVWQGEPLPHRLPCECLPNKPHDLAPSDLDHGVSRYANHFPAGSEYFFHTTFERAFSRTTGGALRAHLGAQQILPIPQQSHPSPSLRVELRDCPSRCSILMSQVCEDHPHKHQLQLTKLKLSTAKPLRLSMTYRLPVIDLGVMWLQIGFVDQQGRSGFAQHRLSEVGSVAEMEWNLVEPVFDQHELNVKRAISWVDGIYIFHDCESGNRNSPSGAALLEIYEITILPQSAARPNCEILDIVLEKRGTGRAEHNRLVWELDVIPEEDEARLPYSPITGPCAYFTIQIDGRDVGRAYATEFVLRMEMEWAEMLEVEIGGIGFDGKIVCHATALVSTSGMNEGSWVLLE
ncbi:Putative glycoside hydrolase, family 85, cytosolic endo-beta-N-acetylglucosaminidase [Septoria linicola]|uniref:Glycoside hydrolase, family 85, cytosolic endo-beta-N-acetylglucosaminidase n=1 Tax=Septoria linicola TaxID=215465 RepID=A0A9Q9AS85_9PEZI|nr:putative glycoside hydrolase, family 85, cytosolic endo-beta-N-acetylglucosaminidase [Septoria linicola]USW49796.1 Putative glycoside hydrolase, family 85, cytosolic endo-beta-N-acetylglucosaminidase [Septoria linicola]